MKFRESDIKDTERLQKMIKKEAESIFSSEKARRGRDLETIEFTVRQGKIAELYLIENYGYQESDKKWHDLFDANGDYTEVKAYRNVWSKEAPFVEKDLRRIRSEKWNFSKWYMLFSVSEGEYELLEKIQIR